MKSKIIIAFGLFLSAALFAQENKKICVNEFLASNVSIDADIVDFGDYSDWIELYNDESVDVDISGYFITDNKKNPSRWKIPPETIIKAKGFLRFWADGYDDMPGRTYWRDWPGPNNERIYFTTDYYHLNFKLSRAGEFIGLFNPDGTLVDSVSYGLQLNDVSMGRQPDGSANWLYFGEPTPEASNSKKGTLNTQFAESTDITPESGFYTGEQLITMNSGSTGATIKYTSNGSKPVSFSETFDTSIGITKNAVIRARTFEEDKLPGNIANRTYFIDDDISLPVISITTPPEVLWDSTFGIYNHRMKDREIPVSFEFFKSKSKREFSMNAALSLTGQASLFYPQISFTIAAEERLGADIINYRIFPQRELNTYKALYLRNGGVPDNRSTLFRDDLQHSLVINKIDIDCQAYLPSVVFLNGEYWGIYSIRDKISSNYIASLYNLNPDDIDLLEYESSIVPTVMNGNIDNYTLFYDYIKSTDLSKDENYSYVKSWMDIDEYINYQICEIYYDNVFWPDQNLRMWRERKEVSKWRWILFDLDFGFGMPNQLSTGYRNNTLAFATSSGTGGYSAPEWSTLIFRKLLLNEEFKTKFIQRFAGYMNSIFQPDTVIALIDKLQDQLSPEMPRHIARWREGENYYGDPIPNYSTWVSNVNVMRNFAMNRPAYQRQHIMDYFKLSGSSVLALVIQDFGTGSVRINDAIITDKNASGIYFRDVPVELKAIPRVGYRFVKWEGVEADSLNPVNIILSEDSLTITALFDTVSINIIPSVISLDTTLSKDNSPYYATDDIVVDSSTTLTIENGVEIRMPEKACIIVYGRLIIAGTKENPVTITPNEFSPDWGALCFVNTTDSSIISNLIIRGATRGHDFTRDKAAISGYNANISLQNVKVENVIFPVFVQYGNVFISGCTLCTNATGDLITVINAESAVIEKCDLMGNDNFSFDAIDLGQISNGIIRGNRIYNFYGFNSDAIDLGENSKDILIENNVIYNICDKGISIGRGSTAIIKRNLIANCGQGVGIKDYGSYGYIEHNTFYANQNAIKSYVKNIGCGGGNADIVNCIIANSRSEAVYKDELSVANVAYSISNTDVLEGIHNISGDPLFLNNLRLAKNSPAFNSGNPSYPNDPDGSPPDMGAFTFDPEDQVNLIINEIHYNPIEGINYQFLELLNAGSSAVNISGYKLAGNIDYTFPDETIDAGEIFLVDKESTVYQGKEYKVFQWDHGDLNKVPGNILLYNNQEDLIDFVNYNSRFWWPREPDGQGPSLELHNPTLENMVSTSWRSSYSDGGTPGKSNNSIEIKGIYINEFMASNHDTYRDEYGESDDYIEFYNSNDNPVNLGGLYITDNLTNPDKHQVPLYAPELTTIPAKGYILFWADGQPAQGVLHLSFKLDATGEQIGLVQMVENNPEFIDSLSYGPQNTDISYGRYPDGADAWHELDDPTPLQRNAITNIQEKEYLPESIALFQNYPNPFRLKTVISYQLSANGEVELNVSDLTGRKVTTLVKEKQSIGIYEVEWYAEGVKPGIYFCELKVGQSRKVMKMILLE
jgi:hypothetical protein